MPISWPASTTAFICSGKVSAEWPGMNQVVFRPYLWNSLSSRSEPTSPANMPREMSSGESSPPYEPSQPPTASTSTPNVIWISLLMSCTPINGNGGGGPEKTGGLCGLFLGNSLSSRGGPPPPANGRRGLPSGNSPPPYEPSQPPTASTSTPNVIWISLLMSCTPINGNGGGGKNLF